MDVPDPSMVTHSLVLRRWLPPARLARGQGRGCPPPEKPAQGGGPGPTAEKEA